MNKSDLIEMIIEKLKTNEEGNKSIFISDNGTSGGVIMFPSSCLFYNPFANEYHLTIAAKRVLDSFLERVLKENSNTVGLIRID